MADLKFTDEIVAHSDDKSRDELSKKTRDQIEDAGREQYFRLRNRWSLYLMIALSASMVFQGALVWSVGIGWLAFKDQSVFLNTVAGELFLQIAGMCLIVVRCLFPTAEVKGKKKKREGAAAE